MSWVLRGNIKGPPGDVGGIPDPLNLDEFDANNVVMIGTRFRFVPLAKGGKLEVKNDAGTWITQSEWQET